MKHFKDLFDLTENFYPYKYISFTEELNDELVEKFLRSIYYIDTNSNTIKDDNEKAIMNTVMATFNERKEILIENQIRLNFFKFSNVTLTDLISDQEYFNNFGELRKETLATTEISEFLKKFGYSIERPGYIDIPIDNFNYYMALKFINENINRILSVKQKYLMLNRNIEKIKEKIKTKFKISSIDYDLYDISHHSSESEILDENRFINNIMSITTALTKIDDILTNYFKKCNFKSKSIHIKIHKDGDEYRYINEDVLQIYLNFNFNSDNLLEFLTLIKLQHFQAL